MRCAEQHAHQPLVGAHETSSDPVFSEVIDEGASPVTAPASAPLPEWKTLPNVCVRCETQPAVEGSDFCLLCNLELYKALGEAAHTLFTRIEWLPGGAFRSSQGVLATYLSTSERFTSSRVLPWDRTR
ncbi:MAG: hypothetical protein HYV26_14615 [Candidatus Hydrogenedentes bacterium]|nr:hypothetical protein [Candidatus Hydrogenedentota bacterium]